MSTTRFSKIQWGDGLTVTPDPDDATVIRVDGTGGPAGATGPAGPTGATGATGAAGPGVPTGGTTGQALTKVSGTDYDTHWVTISGGGGGPTGAAGGALDGSYPNPGLASSVAGAGLSEASDVLSVNVDGTTLAIASDTLKVNTDGNSAHYLNGTGGWTTPSATVAHLDDIGDVTAPTPADEQVIAWDSGAGNWQPKAAVLQGLADAKGDLIAAPSADHFSRLPVGTDGQILIADSTQTTGIKWAAAPGGGFVATDAIWDTKGDLAVASAADTAAKLPVGSNGQVLTADSAQTLGIKWATPSAGAAGAITLLSTTTLGSAGTFNVTGISGAYNDLILVVIARTPAVGFSDNLFMTFNGDTSSHYSYELSQAQGTAHGATAGTARANVVVGSIPASSATAGVFATWEIRIIGYTSTTWQKVFRCEGSYWQDLSTVYVMNSTGVWNQASVVTQVTLVPQTGPTFVAGSQLRIYGRL